MPKLQLLWRKEKTAKTKIGRVIYTKLCEFFCHKHFVELTSDTQIGPGLYLGHAFGITINPQTVIGSNCNIHKGVTLGQENRGSRKGAPVIGDEVWIGINATIVGNIKIGNDVLIAPNSFVNCDVPDHAIVYGNPCIIKRKSHATEGYINNKAIIRE